MESAVFEKTEGFADGAGLKYEVKVSCLLFLRALRYTQEFHIAANFKGAGAFDDVVISYRDTTSSPLKSCFIQLKHKTNQKPISLRNITAVKGDFSLVKYCKSFSVISRQFQRYGDNHPIFGGDLQNCELVIYTNAPLKPQLFKRKKQSRSAASKLLSSNTDTGFVTSFRDRSDLDVHRYFKDFIKCKELIDSMENTKYSQELESTVKQFGKTIHKDLTQLLESSMQRNELAKLSEELGDLSDYQEFLDNLYIFTRQASQDELDSIIKKEIEDLLSTCEVETEAIWRELYQEMSDWWKEENFYITKSVPFWKQILKKRKDRIERLSQVKRCEMQTLGVEFRKDRLLKFPDCRVVNVVTQSTLLSCIKVCQMLENPHIIIGLRMLLHSKEEVLALWPSSWCTTLIIDWESDRQNVDFLWHHHPYGKIIAISNQPLGVGVVVIDHSLITDLDEPSREKVEDKEVIFQGLPISFKSLLRNRKQIPNCEDILLELLSDEIIKVGKNIQFHSEVFISRALERQIYLKKDILTQNDAPGIFAISGFWEYCLTHPSVTGKICMLLKSSENNYNFIDLDPHNPEAVGITGAHIHNGNMENRETDPGLYQFVVIREPNEFQFLYNMYPCVHWLEALEDGRLLWMATKGDITVIQENLDTSHIIRMSQEDIAQMSERIMLIVAEPGMGKSTLVSWLCSRIKEKKSSMWVIAISLNDHTGLFESMGEQSFTTWLHLLFKSAAGAEESHLEKEMLHVAVAEMQQTVVLLDAVDEVTPHYTSQVCFLMTSLLHMGVAQLWVTSRPMMRHHLENELAMLSHTIQPFSRVDQLSYLTQYWMKKDRHLSCETANEFAHRLTQLTTRELYDLESQFMGIPLQTKMMAESFERQLEIFNETGRVILPERLNLIELFTHFVKYKSDIFFQEKM
ncbi:uncharacterized protein [Periplaneta americana]|uniref:uncharacterized protein n=1 Tax=Periplaneta americana TaxID=6978 RepID=UPI0037E97B4E